MSENSSLTLAEVYAQQIAKSFSPLELEGLFSFMEQDSRDALWAAIGDLLDPEADNITPVNVLAEERQNICSGRLGSTLEETGPMDPADPVTVIARKFIDLENKIAVELRADLEMREDLEALGESPRGGSSRYLLLIRKWAKDHNLVDVSTSQSPEDLILHYRGALKRRAHITLPERRGANVTVVIDSETAAPLRLPFNKDGRELMVAWLRGDQTPNSCLNSLL